MTGLVATLSSNKRFIITCYFDYDFLAGGWFQCIMLIFPCGNASLTCTRCIKCSTCYIWLVRLYVHDPSCFVILFGLQLVRWLMYFALLNILLWNFSFKLDTCARNSNGVSFFFFPFINIHSIKRSFLFKRLYFSCLNKERHTSKTLIYNK